MSGILQTLSASAGNVRDPYFNYVTMLLPGNGTNGAQNNTFIDESTNNFTITRTGNTTQGTFSPYGVNWSVFFNGSTDSETIANNAAFNLGTTFTIEFWVYRTSTAAQRVLSRQDASSPFNGYNINYGETAGSWTFDASGTQIIIADTLINQWVHFAWVVNSTSATVYRNGVSVGTGTQTAQTPTTSLTLCIGKKDNSTTYFPGYLSNLRIVKGTAVYTSNFTPSTVPLTAISGTSLLTCQSNSFKDNSSNAFAITLTGTPSVKNFTPFMRSGAYNSSTIGGSAYYDGSGDNLITTSNAVFNPSGQNITVDFWVYLTSYAAVNTVAFEVGNTSAGDMQCVFNNAGEVRFQVGGSVGSVKSGFKLNNWHYVTCVKSGTSLTVYLDAVAGNTVTASPNSKTTLYIGAQSGGGSINGYLSNFRYVSGSANVPSSIPTAPNTAIVNTSLLLNFTNAGIIDNAAMNVFETLGNAQISTTQSKFGGSSIYFDGTGDYLIASSAQFQNFAFGTGDFTIECWLYQTTFNLDTVIMASYGAWATSVNFYFGTRAGTPNVLLFRAGDSVPISLVGNTGITANTWTHVAASRSSGTTRIFVGGVLQTATHSGSVNISATVQPAGIGAANNGSEPITAYINGLRLTKGYARYTATFTPPTAAFPTS